MRLGGRQLAIMRVLWDQGEATVADVQESLDVERSLAYSTVATMMSRLEQKGLIRHRTEGRTFYYQPAVSEAALGRTVVGDVVERIFSGSPSELVNHLLESEQVDAGELDRIKQLVNEHAARRRKKETGRR